MNPVLSVIIPTFRRKDSLALLLKALLAQKSVVPEILVIDQNPPGFLDGVLPVAEKIRRVVLEKPNASDARNQGFLQSKGDFILFIDDDLVPEEDFCSNGLSIFQQYPSIGGFSPLAYNIEGKEASLRLARMKETGRLPENPEIFSITDTISASLFFRREFYRETGGFDPLLFDFAKTAEDQEFFLRMGRRGMTFWFVPAVSVFHDETVPGGCDLRTTEYWITREKCMRSWAYRRRIHHPVPGKLSWQDLFSLSRSGFLNKEGLSSGLGRLRMQVSVLRRAIRSSQEYLGSRLNYYLPPERMDHLK